MAKRRYKILLTLCFLAFLLFALPFLERDILTSVLQNRGKSLRFLEKIVIPQRGHCNKDDVEDLSLCDELTRPNARMCLSQYNVPLKVQEDFFTLLIMTHNRWFLLYDLLPHYTQMKNLSRVVILWYNPGFEPPVNLTDVVYTNGKEVLIHKLVEGYIDLRFQPFREIQTQAVFSLDDDKMVQLEDVEKAFAVWKIHAYTLVGFEKRGFAQPNDSFVYDNNVNSYSLILPSCAFVHREFLRMFNETLPIGMKNMIRALKNCEDIALNMLMSDHCQCAASLYVEAKTKVRDLGPKTQEYSLHQRPTHYTDRTKCLNYFQLFFPKFPLKTISSNCTTTSQR